MLDILSYNSKSKFEKNSIPRVQFIYFHDISEEHLVNLETLLQQLSKKFTFVSYSQAIKIIQENKVDKPYLCISLDDGFKNNINGITILKKFKISACFFVCPSFLGLNKLDQLTKIAKDKFNRQYVSFMDWNDIEYLISQGHEIGSHTMNHVKLSDVNDENAIIEMESSFKILKEHLNKEIHFAYPYGKYSHITKELYNKAFDIGYTSCASAERGCHLKGIKNEADRFLVRRDHIMLEWKLSHILYFLNRNSTMSKFQINKFPNL